MVYTRPLIWPSRESPFDPILLNLIMVFHTVRVDCHIVSFEVAAIEFEPALISTFQETSCL
jgi:hypothetical protein